MLNKKHIRHPLLWLALLFCCFFTQMAQAADEVSPEGNWIKMDKADKPGAVIQIKQNIEDNTLQGTVVKIFDPANNKTMCTDCPESFKNQPIVGMKVLWGAKQASEYTWTDGHILSPKRGKVFLCNITMSQDGQTLTLRVYSESALLGHTETWYRG